MLRELGNRLKRMEKLGQEEDILYQVDDAVEELQKKIDKKSYLLVNSEYWEIGNHERSPKQTQDSKTTDFENSIPEVKSVSDLEALHRDYTNLDGENNFGTYGKQASLPASLLSIADDKEPNEYESKTYESASALSLATFSSLLIEFVARLQNLVDSFKELSEKANFKEPVYQQVPVTVA